MIFNLDYFDIGFEFSACISNELLETLKGPANKKVEKMTLTNTFIEIDDQKLTF